MPPLMATPRPFLLALDIGLPARTLADFPQHLLAHELADVSGQLPLAR